MRKMEIYVKNQETFERVISAQTLPKDGAVHALVLKFNDTFFEALEAAFQYLQGQGREILDYKSFSTTPGVVNLVITYR